MGRNDCETGEYVEDIRMMDLLLHELSTCLLGDFSHVKVDFGEDDVGFEGCQSI